MPGLPLQLIPIAFAGLNTKADPKDAPTGVLSTLENAMATRRTAGGVEVRGRNGFAVLTRTIDGGGSLAAGVMGVSYKDEMVVCDGLRLYVYSPTLGKWIPRGRFQTIAADLVTVSGDETSETNADDLVQVVRPNLDVAYQSGYTCHVSSLDGDPDQFNNAKVHVYVRDRTTGSVVASFGIDGEFKARVCAAAGSFFVFSCTAGGAPSGIKARKIDTATPTTMSVAQDVCADLNDVLVFDAIVDPTGPRMWVAYHNQAGTLTIKSWTTANSAGVSSTYAGVAPYYALGFLSWDYSNGKGYLGVGALAANADVRVIEFSTSTGAETNNTLLDSTGGVSFDQITGYRSSGGVLNVFWYENQFSLGWEHSNTRASSGGSTFVIMDSVAPAGRAFKQGAKWYLPVSIGLGQIGSRTLLLEIDENSTGQNGSVSICGLLQNQDAAGRIVGASCLPSAALLPDGSWMLALPASLNRPASAASPEGTHHYAVLGATLNFAGAGLGRPVEFNGVLHLPACAHKVYDGKSVVEAGFYADPLGLATAAPAVTAGGMTATKTYEYCITVARVDTAGRLHRSAPSPIFSVAMATHTSVSGEVFNFPFTENAPETNDDQNVAKLRIEIWRTEGDGDLFYLNQTLVNDVVGPLAFTDGQSDASLVLGELLYTTSGELDNQKAPAVKVLAVHGRRLFAITGDRSTWYSKVSFEGFGTEMSDDLRILLDDAGGAPTALASVDTSLAFFKRNRTYLLTGVGPDDQGNNPFTPPQPLNADLGAVSAVGVESTPEGIIMRSADGFALLSRSLDVTVMEGAEAFDGLTVTGAALVDGHPFVAFSTGAQLLVRDWQLGLWMEWTNSGNFLAGVAAFRWRNQLCVLQADGTVKVQTAGQFFDGSSTPIDVQAETTWINLSNARVYKALVRGDVVNACTLSGTFRYDLDDTDNASKSIALTSASKQPSIFVPNRGDLASLRLFLHVSGTTEGMRWTSIDLEVGLRPGAAKHRATQYAT